MARPKLEDGEKGNYNVSRVVKKKRLAEKSLRDAERAAKTQKKKAQKASENARQRVSNRRKAVELLNEGGVANNDFMATLPASVKEAIVEDQHELIFSPNEGPQTDFLAAPEKEVLYGGAAGGGKSYALLVDPLRYADNPNHRALLLRRTLGELAELIDQSKKVYPKAFPRAVFKES